MVLIVVLFFWLGYNGLVKRRNQVDNAWSQIDVQLKRRHDLIPNLVETVKGYAAHERGTFEAVTNARANAINAQSARRRRPQAENVLSGALKSLFAVAEAYPDLKANQNFLNLQEELTATEDRIAYARQFYNDSVLTTTPGSRRSRRCSSPACSTSRSASSSTPRPRTPRRRRSSSKPALIGARRSRCERPATEPFPDRSIPCTSRSRATSAARSSCCSASSSSSRWSAAAIVLLFGGGWVGVVIAFVIAIGAGVGLVLQLRQDRASPPAGPSRPTRPSTAATTTSSRGCASPPGSRSRGSTSSTTPRPNAFATGRNPKHAALAVTTGLLEKMNRVELEGVLAHELSHVKNYDILVTTIAVTAVGTIALISDIGLRFVFWGGMSDRRDNNGDSRSARRDHRHRRRWRC